jgi:ATP-binding cassette, subfamily C, type I secretion system permease/ATPase
MTMIFRQRQDRMIPPAISKLEAYARATALWRRAKPLIETSIETSLRQARRHLVAWLNPPVSPHERDPRSGAEAIEIIGNGLRRPLLAVLTFSLVINLLMLTVPLYMMQVYDRVLSTFSIETLVMLTAIALGLLLLLTLLETMRGQLLTRAVLKTEQTLGGPLLKATMEDHRAGRPDAGQALRDLAMLRGFATGPAFCMLFDAPLVPLYILLIFLIHSTLGITALWGAAVILLLAVVNQTMTAKALARAGQAMNRLVSGAELQARNADVVTAMGLAPSLVARFRHRHDAALKAQWTANDEGGYFQVSTRFLRLLLQVGALGLGALLVVKGQITAGTMIAVSIILSRALAPIEAAVSSWRGLIAAKEGVQRIKSALDRLDAEVEAMALPAPRGRLTVENAVLIAGSEPQAVLKGISFALEPGASLGIIGPAASGKTTLGRLVLGVIPATRGKVRLDGADIAQWPRAALGPYIGYLPQEVELFAGSVAENIARMGRPDPAAVVRAAEWAGVQDMILDLPRGFDTPIMEAGLMLTPGQRQRIALARAFYGDPKLVVLDEPNANLDSEGEEALGRALGRAKAERASVIVITHRPGVLQHVDRILLMQAGAALALGPRDEILARMARRATSAGGAPVFNVLVRKPGGA